MLRPEAGFISYCTLAVVLMLVHGSLWGQSSEFENCEDSNRETRGCIITEQREIWADDPFPDFTAPATLESSGIGDPEASYTLTFGRTFSFVGGTGLDITHHMQWTRGLTGYTANCYPSNYNSPECHQLRIVPVDPKSCPDSALTCEMYVAAGVEDQTYAVQYRYDFGVLNTAGEAFIFNPNDHAWATEVIRLEKSAPRIEGKVWRYACTSYNPNAPQIDTSSSDYIAPSDVLGPAFQGCVEAGLGNIRVVARRVSGRRARRRRIRTITDENGNYVFENIRNGRYEIRVSNLRGGRIKPRLRRVRIRNNQATNIDFEQQISNRKINITARGAFYRHRKMYLKSGGRVQICSQNLFTNEPVAFSPLWEVGAIRSGDCRTRRFRNSGDSPLRIEILDNLHRRQGTAFWVMPS